ncbi:MAG: NUDIX domain-containing protein [Parachlamydiales bacterium]|jgi:8-oxo-dGTP pyrophosphatase MutT (NUDIX family)
MPSCAAIAVVLTSDRKQVLLVQRRDTPVWVLPGGGVDEGENPSDAAVRETLEEAGVHVSVVRLAAKYAPLNKMGKETYLFECIPVSGIARPTEEARQAAYFPVDKLPSAFFFIHGFWLRDTLENHAETLYKPLEGVTYAQFIKFFVRHPWVTLRYAISRLGLPWNSR